MATRALNSAPFCDTNRSIEISFGRRSCAAIFLFDLGLLIDQRLCRARVNEGAQVR
jgi:hypothetical protein